jgi:acyl-CoA synthetase (NDP forming)
MNEPTTQGKLKECIIKIKQDIVNDQLIFVGEDSSANELIKTTFNRCTIQPKSTLNPNEPLYFERC